MRLNLLFIALVVLISSQPAFAADDGITNAAFQQALAEYQRAEAPTREAAEKVVKLAVGLDHLPAIPEDARKHFVRGGVRFKDAKTAEDFSQAVTEFNDASRIAPWWPEARYNLGLAWEAGGNYSNAIANLKLYQLFTHPETESRSVQDKIYALEVKAEDVERAAAAQAAMRAEEQRRQEEAERQRHYAETEQRRREAEATAQAQDLNRKITGIYRETKESHWYWPNDRHFTFEIHGSKLIIIWHFDTTKKDSRGNVLAIKGTTRQEEYDLHGNQFIKEYPPESTLADEQIKGEISDDGNTIIWDGFMRNGDRTGPKFVVKRDKQ